MSIELPKHYKSSSTIDSITPDTPVFVYPHCLGSDYVKSTLYVDGSTVIGQNELTLNDYDRESKIGIMKYVDNRGDGQFVADIRSAYGETISLVPLEQLSSDGELELSDYPDKDTEDYIDYNMYADHYHRIYRTLMAAAIILEDGKNIGYIGKGVALDAAMYLKEQFDIQATASAQASEEQKTSE